VHNGHLAIALEARKALGLEEVVLLPAGQPMSKVNKTITAAAHRINMLRLAVKGRRGLAVSTLEIERTGPTFTIDTIRAIQRRYADKTEIFFIMGWDSLEQLPLWREPARLVEMCILVAVPRPGYGRPDMKGLEKKIPGISKKVIILEKPVVDVSATVVREKAARGESIDKMVPKKVAEYIREHKLYGGGEK
jgi:nicotinate-nucleotide adenylyltransferase